MKSMTPLEASPEVPVLGDALSIIKKCQGMD